MKIEDQVLSIEQVRELQELGFNVNKHSSLKSNGEQLIIKGDFYIRGAPLFETMSIGDIIDVLPEKIKSYSSIADEEIYFYLKINNTEVLYASIVIDDFIGCYGREYKLIDNLFDTLVWCIKNKQIDL